MLFLNLPRCCGMLSGGRVHHETQSAESAELLPETCMIASDLTISREINRAEERKIEAKRQGRRERDSERHRERDRGSGRDIERERERKKKQHKEHNMSQG